MLKITAALLTIVGTVVLCPQIVVAKGGYGGSYGSTSVRGHYNRSSGTYVMPHRRTYPNSSKLNNWSTKGNVNPYTGRKGSKKLY